MLDIIIIIVVVVVVVYLSRKELCRRIGLQTSNRDIFAITFAVNDLLNYVLQNY